MIHTAKINIILGRLNFSSKPENVFNILNIEFLNEIHLAINKNKTSKRYVDLFSFGFWCRKNNLIEISKNYPEKDIMLGRGNILHIAPSNVPMNFAYSFAFGLLSGNYNIVRLPTKNFDQIKILCEIIKKILKKKKYFLITKKFFFIRYTKSDEISSMLSKKADARLIWGGDETIEIFKKYYTNSKCVDLNFGNRYSSSIINIKELSKISDCDLNNLVLKFYNDAYTMDQNGCSSPQAIFWIGKKNNKIKNKFWKIFEKIIKNKYDYNFSVANLKINRLQNISIRSKIKFRIESNKFSLVKIKLNKKDFNIDELQGNYGTFCDIDVNSINSITKFISKKFQTISYFGFKQEYINKFIIENKLKGIDRAVPIGRSFDIGVIWDGYDIIRFLSRTISN